MLNLDWKAVSEWLKTTVPGVITLGAIGSIVAVGLLKAASIIGRRLFKSTLDRLFFSTFRPFSFAALLTYRYPAEGRWADLVIYAISLCRAAAAEFVLFGIGVLSTVIIALRLGVQSPGLLVTVVIFTGVLGILLLRDVMGIAGIWAVRFQRDHVELRKLLKNKELFDQLTDQIFRNINTPPQQSQQDETPPAQ